jgi:hypothetical protein
MAHFAELDSNSIVTRVLVVDNNRLTLPNGTEDESLGTSFLQSLFGPETTWKQTSYNGNFRKNYAGVGFTYDPVRDGFIPPMPADGQDWILNEDTLQWELST